MKKILLLLSCMFIIPTMLMASTKIEKLEQHNPVIKAGYKSVNDNAERTDSFLLYTRLKTDVSIKGEEFRLLPSIDIKYDKRDGEVINKKYNVGLLTEYTIPGKIHGIYAKVSEDSDKSNKIDTRDKLGLGLYQYLYKGDKFLFKIREGVQVAVIDYTDGIEDKTISYGKLGFLTGYYVNEFVFFKAKVDYDKAFNVSNNIIDGSVALEYKVTDKFSIETKYTYKYDDIKIEDIQKSQRVFSTFLVYQF